MVSSGAVWKTPKPRAGLSTPLFSVTSICSVVTMLLLLSRMCFQHRCARAEGEVAADPRTGSPPHEPDFAPTVAAMDHRSEVHEFLRTRRARLTPEKANLIAGSSRRVPGLRREEVALLAGVSADYYAQLERGDLAGVSDEVLD